MIRLTGLFFSLTSDLVAVVPNGVNISEDLSWTTHIQTQVRKARQRLYHLRQLRKFRVSPSILKTFYAGTIESVLTQCISVWYGKQLQPRLQGPAESCALS